MEDDLMRLFGGDRLKTMMERLKVPDDVPLENGMVSRSIESAQKKVEGRNFDIRRHVVQYDDVMNKHRELIYKRRQKILVKIAENGEIGSGESGVGNGGNPLHEDVLKALRKEVENIVATHTTSKDPDEWGTQLMHEIISGMHPELGKRISLEKIKEFADAEELQKYISDALVAFYEERCTEADAVGVAQAERVVTLRAIDTHWMDHIDDMAHLREQVAFAGYAQRDPLIEYKDQAFRRFQQLLLMIDTTIVRTLLQVDFRQFQPRVLLQQADEELSSIRTNEDQIEAELEETGVGGSGGREIVDGDILSARPSGGHSKPAAQAPRSMPNVGRNDPCPCGSGKKFKKCHGRS